MTNRLKALKVDFVSMVPRPANQEATFVLAKSDTADTADQKKKTKTKAPPFGSTADGDADDGKTTKQETSTVSHAAVTPPTTEMLAITKADLDAAIEVAIAKATETSQAAIAKLTTDLETTTTRAQASEAIAKAEQDARLVATAIRKAEKELPSLPGTTPSDTGILLNKLAKTATPEDMEALEAILKASSVAVSKSVLFVESGSSFPGQAASGDESAFAKIGKAAEKLREADLTLTTAGSIAKAMELNPLLVKQDRIDRGFAR